MSEVFELAKSVAHHAPHDSPQLSSGFSGFLRSYTSKITKVQQTTDFIGHLFWTYPRIQWKISVHPGQGYVHEGYVGNLREMRQ